MWPAVCVRMLCVRVGRCVACGVSVVWGDTRKGGARWCGPPSFCGFVWAAVSYSPTPWRVQYHRRWQS